MVFLAAVSNELLKSRILLVGYILIRHLKKERLSKDMGLLGSFSSLLWHFNLNVRFIPQRQFCIPTFNLLVLIIILFKPSINFSFSVWHEGNIELVLVPSTRLFHVNF